MRSLEWISARRNRPVSGTATDDQVLRRLRVALDNLYGDRIERVVLFGSRARGDAHEASDYDVAVFLKAAGRVRPSHEAAPLPPPPQPPPVRGKARGGGPRSR